MLTEKQLQALVDCGEKEDCAGETCPIFEICDNDYTNKVAAEAAKTALVYRKMLELKLPENGFEVIEFAKALPSIMRSLDIDIAQLKG